jgi:hypothetical protein
MTTIGLLLSATAVIAMTFRATGAALALGAVAYWFIIHAV